MTSTFETITLPRSAPSATSVDKKAINIPASWYIAMPSKDLSKKPFTLTFPESVQMVVTERHKSLVRL